MEAISVVEQVNPEGTIEELVVEVKQLLEKAGAARAEVARFEEAAAEVRQTLEARLDALRADFGMETGRPAPSGLGEQTQRRLAALGNKFTVPDAAAIFVADGLAGTNASAFISDLTKRKAIRRVARGVYVKAVQS